MIADLEMSCSDLIRKSIYPDFSLSNDRQATCRIFQFSPWVKSEWPRYPLQWRHNERDTVSNRQRLGYLLNCLFMRRSKNAWKLRVTGFVRGIHRWPVDSHHKGPVMLKMVPFDDVTILGEGIPAWDCSHFSLIFEIIDWILSQSHSISLTNHKK